jgi:signal transduction histidine kinase
MMHLEESAPAPAREAARELGEALGRFEPWLPADVLAHYRTKLAALFPDLPPGGTPPAAERLFGPGDLAALEPRLHPPGVSYAPDPVPSRPVSYPVVHAGREHDVVSVPTDGGEAVVHLFLDRAALRAEAARAASDVGFREEGLAFAGAGEPAVAETLRTALPPPLAHLELRYVPADGEVSPGFLAFGLEVIPLATFTWAVVVLVLTIVVGAFFTLRSVLREMRTARLKTDFVSFISHELKTPLTAIRLCSEMLLSGRAGSEEEQKTCLRMLDGESERLARLIDQILQYAQIEQRQKQFHFAACNMREVVEEAVRLFAEHTKDDPREVEINAVQSISKIRMDRAAMIELLLNLLTNAAKYSSSGSRIVINVRESIEDISVDVVDQGIGIRKRDQKRIFEKFYRADDYLTREVEGTGLGLAFARYIARVHNGEIKVSSQVRGGSVFTVYLRKTEVLAE